MVPEEIKGDSYTDLRGTLFYNNNFDVSEVKRIYFIENVTTGIIRAWQGHKIEQRWFAAVSGSFKILLIKIDKWNNPSQDLKPKAFILKATTLDVLHVPSGFVSSIQSLEPISKLIVMSDYLLGDNDDEYRFESNYFKIN